jgi:uncharacterized membrane protein
MRQPPPDEILKLAQQRIAERQAAERQASRAITAARERPWQIIFLTLLAALLLIFVLWPGPSLDWKLYATVHGLVAQKHNVSLGGRELPVCARNIGIYSSFVVSMGYLFARGRGRAAMLPARPILALLAGFVLIMGFDGVNSVLEDTGRAYLYLPRNDLRTISGALFGIALTPILLLVFNQALRADAEPATPVLSWGDLGALLLLNGLLVAAVHSGIGLLYWPLALLAVLSLVGELFVVFTMVIAASMGYMRRITALSELARPASLGLIVTILFVGGLALIRFAGAA